jgi:uncharacterized protein involved in response to NO
MQPIISIGFRLFFLGASVHALLLMVYWAAIFSLGLNIDLKNISIFQWHAHETIFGYAGAVIAGFLLTAVTNWTNEKTLTGMPLLMVFSLWLSSRLIWFIAPALQLICGLLDLLFLLMILIAIIRPIIKTKKWPHLVIAAKLIIIIIANAIFYAGSLGFLSQGVYLGIYLGLIIEVALILTILRRIFPMFAQLGLGLSHPLPSPAWIDLASIILSLAWMIMFLYDSTSVITALLSLMFFIILSIRLWYWYKPTLWQVPLLWSLYMGLAFICMGYALLSASYYLPYFHYFGIHALTYGGIGLVTFSMMARVSLGHTGHNVRAKNPKLTIALVIFTTGIVFRVLMPLFLPQYLDWWLMGAQLLWTLGFGCFLAIFTPILLKPSQ